MNRELWQNTINQPLHIVEPQNEKDSHNLVVTQPTDKAAFKMQHEIELQLPEDPFPQM